MRPFVSITLFNRCLDIGWRVLKICKWSNDRSIWIFGLEFGLNYEG